MFHPNIAKNGFPESSFTHTVSSLVSGAPVAVTQLVIDLQNKLHTA